MYSCLLGSIDLGYNREIYFVKRQKDLTLFTTKLPDSLVVAISCVITNSGVQNLDCEQSQEHEKHCRLNFSFG